MSTNPVKCVRCKTDANIEIQGKSPVKLKCPKCGAAQSHAEFQKSLGEQVAAHTQDVLGKSFARMARSSKGITYKPGRRIKISNPKFTVGF